MHLAGFRSRFPHRHGLLLLVAACLQPATASAGQSADAEATTDRSSPDEDPPLCAPSVSFGASISAVSDYRFRGISNSDIAPAFQPSLQLDTPGGAFLGLWGSNITNLSGADAEIDLSGGWAGTVGLVDVSAGAIAYLFPGARNANVVELFGTAGLSLGPASATLGLNWAPEQANLPRASRYAFLALAAAIPGKPLRLRASIGHEQGGLPLRRDMSAGAKWDWLLGVDVTLPGFTVGVAYVDTDLPGRDTTGQRANRLGQAGLLLKLSAHF